MGNNVLKPAEDYVRVGVNCANDSALVRALELMGVTVGVDQPKAAKWNELNQRVGEMEQAILK